MWAWMHSDIAKTKSRAPSLRHARLWKSQSLTQYGVAQKKKPPPLFFQALYLFFYITLHFSFNLWKLRRAKVFLCT